jgi:hypothetical protein
MYGIVHPMCWRHANASARPPPCPDALTVFCPLQAMVPGLPGPSKGTALHMACVNFCCPDTMQLLLKHGADIHAQLRSPDRTLDKATPLLLTVRLGAQQLPNTCCQFPALQLGATWSTLP